MISATYQVTGMTCEHCVRAVTGELQNIRGVTSDYQLAGKLGTDA